MTRDRNYLTTVSTPPINTVGSSRLVMSTTPTIMSMAAIHAPTHMGNSGSAPTCMAVDNGSANQEVPSASHIVPGPRITAPNTLPGSTPSSATVPNLWSLKPKSSTTSRTFPVSDEVETQANKDSKKRSADINNREKAVKQRELELNEITEQATHLKSLALSLEQKIKTLKEENTLLKTRLLLVTDTDVQQNISTDPSQWSRTNTKPSQATEKTQWTYQCQPQPNFCHTTHGNNLGTQQAVYQQHPVLHCTCPPPPCQVGCPLHRQQQQNTNQAPGMDDLIKLFALALMQKLLAANTNNTNETNPAPEYRHSMMDRSPESITPGLVYKYNHCSVSDLNDGLYTDHDSYPVTRKHERMHGKPYHQPPNYHRKATSTS